MNQRQPRRIKKGKPDTQINERQTTHMNQHKNNEWWIERRTDGNYFFPVVGQYTFLLWGSLVLATRFDAQGQGAGHMGLHNVSHEIGNI